MQTFNSFKCFIAILVITVLASCSQIPQTGSQTSSKSALLQQAETALEKARSSISPDKEYHQLKAAGLLYQAGEHQSATELLAQINSSNLHSESFINFTLLYSNASLANDDYLHVKQLSTSPRIFRIWSQLSAEQQKQLLTLRADIQMLLGEDQQAIDSYYQLAPFIRNTVEIQSLNDKLWSILTRIPQHQLLARSKLNPPPELAAWYQLATLQRDNQGNIRRQVESFQQWKSEHPQHTATRIPPTPLENLQNLSSTLPQQLAVILPTTGNLANAGKAIQSGFMAAWFEAHEAYQDAPAVKFYNSASSTSINDIYNSAIEDGAELIIGPLNKQRVAQLAAESTFPVPTISLNYLETTATDNDVPPHSNLIQMGLAAEDEAAQIAQRAWLEGHRHVLLLYPQTKWAERVATAFQTQWQSIGGTLEKMSPYQRSINDFAPLLKPVLHIDQSTSRNQRLERLLGKNLAFTPRRRQDLDMVFLIAYPNQARQIKPTLNFLFAADLPVYATSHIYNGTPERGRNRDLNDIVFSAMPWTLDGHLPDQLKPDDSVSSQYRQLYALGMDVYLLQQWMSYLQKNPSATLSGSTGSLHINQQGSITREHPWATFKSGRVIPAATISSNQ